MYRNIHFRKPRTRSSPTRNPDIDAMRAYMMMRLGPGRKERAVPGKQSIGIAMQSPS